MTESQRTEILIFIAKNYKDADAKQAAYDTINFHRNKNKK